MRAFHLDCYSKLLKPEREAEDEIKTVVKAKKTVECSKCELWLFKNDKVVLLVSRGELDKSVDEYCQKQCERTVKTKTQFKACIKNKVCPVALKSSNLQYAQEMGWKIYSEMKLVLLLESVSPELFEGLEKHEVS